MKALLLAAGYATRLYPLTLDRPKALLPVGGQPIVDYILQNIKRLADVNETYLITNHKFYKDFKEWSVRWGVRVIDDGTFSNDDRLGAIGDIEFAIKKGKVKEDILVVGADNIFDEQLSDFLKFAVSKKGSNCIGLYVLADE